MFRRPATSSTSTSSAIAPIIMSTLREITPPAGYEVKIVGLVTAFANKMPAQKTKSVDDALDDLREQAQKLGAQAVVGIQISCVMLSITALLTNAVGTAVQFVPAGTAWTP